MSLQFVDGFASNAVTADLSRKWTSNGGALLTSGGVDGGNCLQFTSNANSWVMLWPSAGKFSVTVYFGAWFKINTPPASNQFFLGGIGTNQNWSGGLGVISSGQLCLYNQNAGSPQNTLTLPCINVCNNAWHWLEVAMTLPPQATSNNGFVNCYIDSVQLGGNPNGSGNTFGFNAVGGLNCWGGFLISGQTGCTTTWGKLVVWDSVSPLPTAFPMGPQAVSTLRPTSDSAVAFTPNTGTTNYTQVDEVVPDDDSSYVQANPGSALQDLYGYGALGYTPAAINGVMVNTRLRNPGYGTATASIVGKSGATTRVVTAAQIGPWYNSTQQEFGVDPNTSALWTPTNLGNATFGVRAP